MSTTTKTILAWAATIIGSAAAITGIIQIILYNL